MSHALLFPSAFVGSLALYLLFAGQLSWTELAAGLMVACSIAAFAAVQHTRQSRRLKLQAPWARVVWAPLASLVTDSARVAALLVRTILRPPADAAGVVARQPFRTGGDQPREAGRRAIVTLGSSLAPNGFVMDVAPSALLPAEDVLVVHRLAPRPPKADPEWPL